MSYLGRKSGRAALIHADIPENLNLLGDYVKIPSATTTERDELTAAVGMLIYNSTIGLLQQYNAVGWQSIDSPPTLSSFTYPDSQTALDPAGSTTATLVLTGSNFSIGVTVLIDGTAPTATTRNSSTQITITGYPAKAAATYSAGLKVTNASGLAASNDIVYDAIPAWTTAAGSLGSFADGAYTNSSTPTIRIVAAEGSDTIDYAQVSDAGGGTVITSGVAGLTLGTTGANAGYLTGTLAGTAGTTYNFYAKAQDDENQFSAVRLFDIRSPTVLAFTYTGADQAWTCPAGITSITVSMWGAAGGNDVSSGFGGAGAYMKGTVAVTAGASYMVVVGQGGRFDSSDADVKAGYGGGGSGYEDPSGGGLSGFFQGSGDIFDKASDSWHNADALPAAAAWVSSSNSLPNSTWVSAKRNIMIVGGGGGSDSGPENGGNGGGGATSLSGGAGTRGTTAGAGGYGGKADGTLQGGQSNASQGGGHLSGSHGHMANANISGNPRWLGGGGGGYMGGMAVQNGNFGDGCGGGGSSFYESTLVTSVTTEGANAHANGQGASGGTSGLAYGAGDANRGGSAGSYPGQTNTSTGGAAGNHGRVVLIY